MPEFTLREFFHPGDQVPVSSADGQPLIHQLVAYLVNDQRVYMAFPFSKENRTPGTSRDFILGSEWLYLKVYCTSQLADMIISRHILPVIRQMEKKEAIKWFFIRYNDPGYHLRLRFKICPESAGKLISLLKKHLSPLAGNQLIREYQADTYRRELERYGADIIGEVEDFFFASSEMVAHQLTAANPVVSTDLFAIAGFALLINQLLPEKETHLPYLVSVNTGFQKEFSVDKAFRLELDTAYRPLRDDFAKAADMPELYINPKANYYRSLKQAVKSLLVKADRFGQQRKTALVADLIHMHLNRVYSDQQRRHEMVLYYYFHKYEQSRAAIARRSAPETPPALD